MARLFTPFRLREVELKNRIVVSPMCEYSAVDGHPQPWHLVHLGSRAVGGAGLVFTEATAVEARGRISRADTGMYLASHVDAWRTIAEFGGSFENRIRIVLQVIEAVRQIWPASLPLFVRVSATDWKEGGWDLEQTSELSKRLKTLGVDLIDVSSGGVVPGVQIPIGPGYQVKFAEEIRKQAGIATGAVGMITEPEQADAILKAGQADLVIMARELLRDPYWPRRAAQVLGGKIKPPVQYERAW